MTTIRNLTFRSRDLGDDVSLMLCFTPPSPDLYNSYFPVAWKVTTLKATGGSIMPAQWVSTYAVCSAQIYGSTNRVTAGTYVPIGPGQMTTLERSGPYSLKWTTPMTQGGTTIKAKNGTDTPVSIGAGFMIDVNTDREEMNTTVVYKNVWQGLTVNTDLRPVLSAYVALDYQQDQIVNSEIMTVDPVWSDNLLGLSSDTTIWIRKTPEGGYRADVVPGIQGDISHHDQ